MRLDSIIARRARTVFVSFEFRRMGVPELRQLDRESAPISKHCMREKRPQETHAGPPKGKPPMKTELEYVKFSFPQYLFMIFILGPGLAVMYVGLIIRGVRDRGWRKTFDFTAP